jgi:ACS family glucarate transporter-like MFS transporter
MTIPHRPGYSYVRWSILALLFAASFVAYLLRTNISIAGERIMAESGLDQTQFGWVLAAFAWGYALFQFAGGVLGDRIGGRKALTLIAVLWGGLTLAVGLMPATSPMTMLVSLVVIRFLLGAANAPLYPVTSGGLTCNWFPVAGWAVPNALTNTGLTLGSAAAGPLIAWLVMTMGWRMSFIVTAPLAFILAAVWWWYARDTPAEHPGVAQEELALIDAGRSTIDCGVIEPGAWKAVLRNRNVLLLTLSYFCSNYVFYFFFNWLYIYLVDSRGFKGIDGGLYSALPWIIGAFGATIGGFACDALCKSRGMTFGCRWPAVIGLLIAAVMILAAARATAPVVAVVFLSLCLFGQQMTEGAFWAATISISGRQASAACGVLNTGGNVVGGVGALLVPFVVKQIGWPAALGSASIFAVVAALIWFAVDATPQTEPVLRGAA